MHDDSSEQVVVESERLEIAEEIAAGLRHLINLAQERDHPTLEKLLRQSLEQAEAAIRELKFPN